MRRRSKRVAGDREACIRASPRKDRQPRLWLSRPRRRVHRGVVALSQQCFTDDCQAATPHLRIRFWEHSLVTAVRRRLRTQELGITIRPRFRNIEGSLVWTLSARSRRAHLHRANYTIFQASPLALDPRLRKRTTVRPEPLVPAILLTLRLFRQASGESGLSCAKFRSPPQHDEKVNFTRFSDLKASVTPATPNAISLWRTCYRVV